MGDADQAVIRLRLRKPPHWRLALRTSRSAPAVRVLEDGAEEEDEGQGGDMGVELLVDVAEASERRCSPRVRAILAGEGQPPSRSASARLRSLASRGNAVLKQKSDSSLERRAKATGFGPLPSTSGCDVPKEDCSESHSETPSDDKLRSGKGTSVQPVRSDAGEQNRHSAPSGLGKPEAGEAKFQSRIARPVVARKTLPDSSGAPRVEQSRLPCLRPVSGEKSGRLADVTKRYSDSSLGSLSKVMKLRNRLSQSSTGTDTPDTVESVLSDSSVPTVRGASGSASGTDSVENISAVKQLPSRVPFHHNSVSCRSSSLEETKKRHPGMNSLRRKEAQQERSGSRKTNDFHEKAGKDVPTQSAADRTVKSQPTTHHTSTRKGRTSDPSKDCSRIPASTRSQGIRNTSSQRSQAPKVEEPKGIKQPQQRPKTLSEVQSQQHRKLAMSRSKDAIAERKQSSVKKQKSDSSLDSTFSSAAAEGRGKSKSKIPLGHRKTDATAGSPSHLAPGAYGTRTQLASARPVCDGAANKHLRPTVIPRLACSSAKTSGGPRRAAEAETAGISSSAEELDAVMKNVSRASSVKLGGQRSPRTSAEDMDDVCLGVSVEVASCGGSSGSRGRSPDCEAMYVAYVVTTPDSEIGAPMYRVDSPSVSSVCDVEIVPFDDDLEAEPVFRPARRYFGYGGSFKRLSDFDEKDLAAERRSSSFGSRPSRPCSNSGSSASGSLDTNKQKQTIGQCNSRLEKMFRDRDVTSSSGRKAEQQSRTKPAEEAVLNQVTTSRKTSSRKQSNIPRIRVSPQKEDVKKNSGKRNPKHSAGLYSYLLKYRPSSEQFSDPEVLSVATETATSMSRMGHARGDSGVYSLNGSMRDRSKQRLQPPSVEGQQQQQQHQGGRKRRRRRKRRSAECQGCGGCDVGGGEAMGSSASRQPAGLAGRRAHSSGSLPRTAGAASAMAPASTGGAARGRSSKLCKDRAKLCGSLPNHLDCNDASNGLDQGYGSERSPDDEEDDEDDDEDEEEEDEGDETCHCATYPFLNTDCAFSVELVKGSRGLGLSVCGGADSNERWPGLVRVKRLFPQQPAWMSGRLQPGDILLAANGVSLVGLTDYQALEVLRRTPSRVSLRVVRPPGSLMPAPPPAPGQPPPPPRRDAHLSHQLLPPPPSHADDSSREFDIVLTKVNRSLGFTLRKEDESVLGHYVRALVREPALSDGRIRPGDKIVAVNDVDISPMSHEEAVMFLRQCGDVVKLRLYRDESQTPVSALSPTEEEKPFKPKPLLRKEARDMLTDLAVRKMSPGESSYSGSRLRRVSADSSPCSSPRRRHLTRSSPSDNKAATLERMPAGQKYMVSSQSQTSTSDSSEEHSQNNSNTLTCSSSADADADSTRARGHASSFSSTAGSVGEPVKPLRPNFLDLCGAVGSITPQTRKPRLVFGSSGEAEWEEDEGEPPPEPAPGSPCPRYSSSCCSSSGGGGDMMPLATDSVEPVSMPPLSSTSSTSTAFSYRNPAYQSAVDATGHRNQSDRAGTGTSGAGAGGLLKWKGVVFTPEDGNGPANGFHCPPEADKAPDAHLPADYEPGDQIFMVELTRGWNSRLGFSLQGNGQHTYISAIYADSVAAKDGRLQAGDRVLMVNDENVETMSTADVIDLLRKIRGTIGITVLRKHKQDLTTPLT